MGKARNQRSKGEATFLEQVKQSIQALCEEVKAVKLCVYDLKQGLHYNYDHAWTYDYYGQNSVFPSCFDIDGAPSPHSWDLLKGELDQQSITKEELLLYRHTVGLGDEPKRLYSKTLLDLAAIDNPLQQQLERCDRIVDDFLDEYFSALDSQALLKWPKLPYHTVFVHDCQPTPNKELEQAPCIQPGFEADGPNLQWSTAEIEDWTRCTIRMANEAAMQILDQRQCRNKRSEMEAQQECKDARSQVIRQRWESAKHNIPETLRRGFLEALLQI